MTCWRRGQSLAILPSIRPCERRNSAGSLGMTERSITGESGMRQHKGLMLLSIFIITIGIGDLLTTLDIIPGVDWVWTLALAIVGILVIVLSGGLDKVSVVIGPFLLITSGLSILRQTGHLDPKIEASLIVILIGVLLLVSQLSNIPPPRWSTGPADSGDKTSRV
jgi:hypothetical protein